MYSVYGTQEMEMQANLDPSGDRPLERLRTGFRRLTDPAGAARWHLSFLPLRLHPESGPIGQLASAMFEAEDRGLTWPAKWKKAMEDYFDNDPDATRLEDAPFTCFLWRLYGATGPRPNIAPRARCFLDRLRRSELIQQSDAREELVDAICAAVASSPPSSAQSSFFDELHRRGDFWSDGYLALLLDRRLFGPPRSRWQDWNALRSKYRAELARIATPTTPGGRALLRSLVQRLDSKIELDNLPNTVDTARELAERLEIGKQPRLASKPDKIPFASTSSKTGLLSLLQGPLAAARG